MVAVGNSTSVGGGTQLTPEADTEDGRLDVMISLSTSMPAKLGYVVQLARKTHHERDDVLYLHGHEVSISGEGFFSAADGEISGPERRRTWRLVPSAYSMVLPPEPPAPDAS
jgi:diacylglycerol kinase family enzyme